MATQVQTGFNGVNLKHFIEDVAGPVADTAAFTVQLPAEYIGKAAIPHVHAIGTYGAGAPGARTLTLQPTVALDTAATVGVAIDTYNEATGVLTCRNLSGGSLSAIRVHYSVLSPVQ